MPNSLEKPACCVSRKTGYAVPSHKHLLPILAMLVTMVVAVRAQTESLSKDELARLNITKSDYEDMKDDLEQMIPSYRAFWAYAVGLNLATKNATFPKMIMYARPLDSACGKVAMWNAYYCVKDNTIYIDVVFLTVLAKIVTAERAKRDAEGTRSVDAHFAALIVIAHELGHALSHAYGVSDKVTVFDSADSLALDVTFMNDENRADCLAGAFASYLMAEHLYKPRSYPFGLPLQSVLDAEQAMVDAGDIQPDWIHVAQDKRTAAVFEWLANAHKTGKERLQFFKDGLSPDAFSLKPKPNGIRLCLTVNK